MSIRKHRLKGVDHVPSNLVLLALAAASLFSQASYPCVFNTLAGSYSLGDAGPATKALLLNPTAVALGGAGNLYELSP